MREVERLEAEVEKIRTGRLLLKAIRLGIDLPPTDWLYTRYVYEPGHTRAFQRSLSSGRANSDGISNRTTNALGVLVKNHSSYSYCPDRTAWYVDRVAGNSESVEVGDYSGQLHHNSQSFRHDEIVGWCAARHVAVNFDQQRIVGRCLNTDVTALNDLHLRV